MGGEGKNWGREKREIPSCKKWFLIGSSQKRSMLNVPSTILELPCKDKYENHVHACCARCRECARALRWPNGEMPRRDAKFYVCNVCSFTGMNKIITAELDNSTY